MNSFFSILLFVLWTMFGSFASVIIYRIRSWEWGMFTWRSHCQNCERNLSARELIPVLSWVFQWWKCMWCQQKISPIYPLLELTTWILFVCVWYFLVNPELVFLWDTLEVLRLFFFLSIIFFTVIYVFYDILYLEIPESILWIANFIAFWGLALQWIWFEIFPYLPVWGLNFWIWVLSFWIITSLYIIVLAWLREIYDIAIICVNILILFFVVNFLDIQITSSALLSGSVAALWIFISFFLQIVVSKGRWMWAGDLRIAILMWLIVGITFTFPAWMITYLAWSIIWIWLIIFSKIQRGYHAKFDTQIPFWPFLACGYLAVLFFYPQISSIIELYIY